MKNPAYSKEYLFKEYQHIITKYNGPLKMNLLKQLKQDIEAFLSSQNSLTEEDIKGLNELKDRL